jgi:hypothetical protein
MEEEVARVGILPTAMEHKGRIIVVVVVVVVVRASAGYGIARARVAGY